MISKKIIDFANTISFTVKDDSAYGFIDKFLFSVYEKGSKKCFFAYYHLENENSASKENPVSIMTITNSLSEIFKKYEITEYSHKDNGIEISCTLPYKKFYSLMRETAKTLSSFAEIKTNICDNCNAELNTDEKRFRISYDFSNCILCSECASELLGGNSTDDESIQDETEDTPNSKSSILKGILGSLLFSFGIGLCLFLLYAYVIPLNTSENGFKSGYYVNWLSAIMAFASFWGYSIFSKLQFNNKQLLISGGISAVISFITQYLCSMVLFARESILTFENLTYERFSKMIPSLLKIPFTDKYVSSDFKIYVLMNLIFIVVSLLVISFFITPKKESEIFIEEL